MKKRALTIAAWGWIALAVWFIVFEGLGWLIQDWTLSQQWWEWMQAIPGWLAWVFFAGYIALGVHLWWPRLMGKK
jgi:hypothetical protein